MLISLTNEQENNLYIYYQLNVNIIDKCNKRTIYAYVICYQLTRLMLIDHLITLTNVTREQSIYVIR